MNGDGLIMGPPMVPGVDLGRDPNMPSKREQIRLAASNMVTGVMIEFVKANPGAVQANELGKLIADGAEKLAKFIDG